MGDWRQMGHAQRRRMGAPTNHFGAAMANKDDYDPDDPDYMYGPEGHPNMSRAEFEEK